MRTAVYSGTRNVYGDIETALKSLLYHTQVDKVYILAEDDELPVSAPNVEVVNVSGQTFFDKNGPNYSSPWTYMPLMRAAYSKMFKEDIVLSLDIDTIVTADIGELWDINMDGYMLAGAAEPNKQGFHQPYVNFGVLLMNLPALRGLDDVIIRTLNTEYTFANEQDVMNTLCREHIRLISSAYNACSYTAPCAEPKIVHYAGIGENFPWSRKRWQDEPLVQKYRAMSWEDICRNT